MIQDEKAKEKSATKIQEATDEVAYLMTFNQNIIHAMAGTMHHLSDFVSVNMVNVTRL